MPPRFDPQVFSNIGGAAADLFAGLGAATQADLRARGLGLQAAGTRISAEGLGIKAMGDLAEASNYELAASLAKQNAGYIETSTAIQEMQLDREVAQTIGLARASYGASGLAQSGSALDVLRDSASQGALAHRVLAMQGQITEAGYEEQAQAYTTMAATGQATAAGEQRMSAEELRIAAQTDDLAQQTRAAGQQAAIGDFVGGAIKGVAAVAGLVLAP